MSLRPDGQRLLRTIARSCGIAPSYLNYVDEKIDIPDDTLLALINALEGRDLPPDTSADNLHFFMNMKRAQVIGEGLPRVLVAWGGKLSHLWLWAENDDGDFTVTLTDDSADSAPITINPKINRTIRRENVNAWRLRLECQTDIPFGYYEVTVAQGAGIVAKSFLISAPATMKKQQKSWGVFAPVYGLRSARDWGVGGYRELYEASCQVRRLGGSFIGTLPLLPISYEGERPDPSPYAPLSRLFWNEIYLDIDNLPGRNGFTPDASLQAELDALRADTFVDYPRVHAIKQKILSEAAEAFFTEHPEGDADYKTFAAQSPYLDAYAAFRGNKNYHRYVQYACHRQMARFKTQGDAGSCAELYLDYPVGVNPGGFDAREFAGLFLQGFSVGAPPDLFFSRGQNWGFRPFNPRAFINDRFRYFRATLAHYFRYAKMLRLDHIMGLYRIYCIPEGHGAKDGAYIFYPFDAFLAVLCLEAYRHDGVLIGEDLGTVPLSVRRRMQAHGIHRMWIGQFEMKGKPEGAFTAIEPMMIASFNTHDMFPLPAYLKDDDMAQLQSLSLLDAEEAEKIIAQRQKDLKLWRAEKDAFMTGVKGMAESAAAFVMISPEDAWGDNNPQNIPGTMTEYPNWRKKLRHPIEGWDSDMSLKAASDALNAHRGAAPCKKDQAA